jgi:hypothetical protein
LFAIVMAESAKVRSREERSKLKITRRTVLAHQCHQRTICAPYDIFHRWTIHLCDSSLLLDIIKHNRRGRAQDETGGASVEDLISLYGRLDSFDNGVRKVTNLDELFLP